MMRLPAPRLLRFSWLDFKVGLRMLARYPGLTAVGTLAIAVAIALGSIYFEALNKGRNPRLPVPDADRVVSILNWDTKAIEPDLRALHDFAVWREQVKTVDHLGAAVLFVRNLGTADGRVEPVRGAEITASAFQLMGTRPLLGRALTAQDERPGEPAVVVIGHTLWKTRFDSDPAVVGRAVKLGTTSATIIGVMPEGFGFPISQRIWTPLRTDGSLIAPRTGPDVRVFGRLAPGASMGDARTELGVIAARLAAADPEPYKQLRPRVEPYEKPLAESREGRFVMTLLNIVNGIFLMLLAIVCTNVATLVFARTATRGWEISVRTALGASRGRIVTQLFIEALVLTGVAAVVGLGVAKVALRFGLSQIGSDALPFWVDDSLSWRTVLYAGLLTLFGAAIIGILPALRVTKLNVQDSLRSEGAARSGLKFGGFWTAVIVAQVAITVAFLPLAAGGVFEANRFNQRAEGIGAARYLIARVEMDREDYRTDSAAFNGRARNSVDELERRLGAEPGVERIAFADRLPVEDQFKYQIEVDTTTGAPTTGLRVSTLVHVSRGFFSAFGTSVVAGRDFVPLDFETGHVMIVNQSFARHVFGDRNPIGQRIRVLNGEDMRGFDPKQWYEVVGMVKDFGWQLPEPREQSAMYRPSLPVVGRASQLALRLRDPESFASRLRTIAAEVDPTVRLADVRPLTEAGGGEAQINWALTGVAWLVGFIVLLLSATGIHALMSFTVARRTREIGIRVALGASSARLVSGIFSRAFLQISLGLLVGSGLVALLGVGSVRQLLLLLAADGIMLVVGLAACAVPLRRALRIEPTEALRAEA